MYSNLYACPECAIMFAQRPERAYLESSECPVCGYRGRGTTRSNRHKWYKKVILDEPEVRD